VNDTRTKRIEGQREPTVRQSYGSAAERFNAERELGRRTLEAFRLCDAWVRAEQAWPERDLREAVLGLRVAAHSLGLISVAPATAPTCDTLLCANEARERGNGSANLCEDCAHERMRAMHDVLSDILAAPESMLLVEHRRDALEALGLSEEDFARG
jgi:hypothetical protein